MVDGSVKSEIIEDPQRINFSEIVETDEREVKVEANLPEHSQNMGCVQNSFVPQKALAMARDRSGEKGVSKMKFFFKDLRAEILGGNRLWSN